MMQPKLDVPVAWGHPLGEISPNMTVTTNKGVCDRLACCTFFLRMRIMYGLAP